MGAFSEVFTMRFWKFLFSLRVWNWVPSVLISVVAIGLIWMDLSWQKYEIDWKHIALLAIAILPWARSFLASISISSTGFEVHLRELEETVSAIVEGQTEPDDIDTAPTRREANEIEKLDQSQKQILSAILNSNKYTLRSVSGIRKDASIPREFSVRLMLEELHDGDFVRKAVGRKGNILWAITSKGRKAVSS
ncbi:MAG: hypothetical protein AAF557_05690 [Pseudomonadota bacterium]